MWEVAGSVIGQMMAQGKYDEIAKIRAEAKARFGNTSLSSLESIAKEQLGPSKLGGVSMDGKYKAASDEALDRMMGIAKADGMDAQSISKLNQAKNAAYGVERGMRGAADATLARRGMFNSGAAVSSAHAASQAGTDRAYQGSIATAADASERALQALMNGGNMASRLGQADLDQKNRVAGADDRIAEFNLGHRAGSEKALIDAKLRIAGGMSGVAGQQAGDLNAAADRDVSIARGVGAGADAAGKYGMSYIPNDNAIDPVTGKKKAGGDPYDRQQDW